MLELDKATFETEVLQADGYIFVDFYGEACAPCQALEPMLQEMAQKYGDKLKFTAVNTTKQRRLAIAQKVMGLPVIAIYKDGVRAEALIKDDCTVENIEALIKKYIS